MNKFPKVCEFYWNNHWAKGTILYRMTTGGDQKDVRSILQTPINSEIISVAKTFTGTLNEKALKCHKWVVSNIAYESDEENWGKPEYWQDCNITFKKETGDCEDMSILLMRMMQACGIPAWRRKICCGTARDGLGRMVGHAYCLYLTEEYVWTALDPAYYPLESVSNFGTPQSKVSNYGELWFTFNEEYSWHQRSTIFLY